MNVFHTKIKALNIAKSSKIFSFSSNAHIYIIFNKDSFVQKKLSNLLSTKYISKYNHNYRK